MYFECVRLRRTHSKCGPSIIMRIPEIEVGGLSVMGPVREDNQDAILYPNGAAPGLAGMLHAVADGMGGYSHGGIASSTALKSLTACLQGSPSLPPHRALRKGMERANLDVYRIAQKMGAGRMGTTLTAACLVGEHLHLVHVGDSRLYLVRDGRSKCLTSDHTLVADMVRSRLISPDKVRTHAQRSILTRAVGLGLFIQPELVKIRLKADDRLILCSDGVWSVIQDDEFALLAGQARDTHTLSQALVDLALERQTDDNCSVVAVHIPGFHTETAAQKSAHRPAWFGRSSQDGLDKQP
jgi:PPM family protein phosphatase